MNSLKACDLASQKILISEPFAKFLHASPEEYEFEISLLDIVRFSGHACISVTGAFFSAREAIRRLYPDTNRCIRGDLEVYVRGEPESGATGPIANVLSFITGAWASTGFGGLNGQHVRRGLLHFATELPPGVVRFRRRSTNQTIDVLYRPSNLADGLDSAELFQDRWREHIARMLHEPASVIEVRQAEMGL